MQGSICDECKWADIHDGPRRIIKGSVILTQDGGHNIVCTHKGDKSMTFMDDDMQCSGWEPRGEE